MMHPPEPSTEREYLIEIYSSVQNIRQSVDRVCQTVEEHGQRIDALEHWRSRISTQLAFFTAVGGGIGATLGYILRGLVGSPGP